MFELLKADTPDAALAAKLNAQGAPDQGLVMLPWASKSSYPQTVAASLGQHGAGAALAFYTLEGLPWSKVVTHLDRDRKPQLAFLDLSRLSLTEAQTLVRTWATPPRRSGLRGLLQPSTPAYVELWQYASQAAGRAEVVTGLPEVQQNPWKKRHGSIRVLLSALHALVFEEGSGQLDAPGKPVKGYFQIGADEHGLVLRLIFRSSLRNPAEALTTFLPSERPASHPVALLYRFADYLRVQALGETADLEVTAALLPTAPSESSLQEMRSAFLSKITTQLVGEPPFETPESSQGLLKALPASVAPAGAAAAASAKAGDRSRDHLLVDAAQKIKELKTKLTEKEEELRELRSGGFGGTAPPLPPPDVPGLLESVEMLYGSARERIAAVENQVAEMAAKTPPPAELEGTRARLKQLQDEETEWMKKLLGILEAYKKSKQRPTLKKAG